MCVAKCVLAFQCVDVCVGVCKCKCVYVQRVGGEVERAERQNSLLSQGKRDQRGETEKDSPEGEAGLAS